MALRAIVDNLTLPELGAKLHQFHAASAQRRLLASIDTALVLFGEELGNCANGESRRLPTEEGLDVAGRIARAARSLVPGASARILLLLPPSSFIGTRFMLGVQGESLLRSALSLQAASQHLQQAAGPEAPLFGVLSLGEIANNGTHVLDFYNKTFVLGAYAHA
jgi:hypothetical protein